MARVEWHLTVVAPLLRTLSALHVVAARNAFDRSLASRAVPKSVLSHFVLHNVERFDICFTIECPVELVSALCAIRILAIWTINNQI